MYIVFILQCQKSKTIAKIAKFYWKKQKLELL